LEKWPWIGVEVPAVDKLRAWASVEGDATTARLASTSEPTLVWGWPGAGKTILVSEAVRTWLALEGGDNVSRWCFGTLNPDAFTQGFVDRVNFAVHSGQPAWLIVEDLHRLYAFPEDLRESILTALFHTEASIRFMGKGKVRLTVTMRPDHAAGEASICRRLEAGGFQPMECRLADDVPLLPVPWAEDLAEALGADKKLNADLRLRRLVLDRYLQWEHPDDWYRTELRSCLVRLASTRKSGEGRRNFLTAYPFLASCSALEVDDSQFSCDVKFREAWMEDVFAVDALTNPVPYLSANIGLGKSSGWIHRYAWRASMLLLEQAAGSPDALDIAVSDAWKCHLIRASEFDAVDRVFGSSDGSEWNSAFKAYRSGNYLKAAEILVPIAKNLIERRLPVNIKEFWIRAPLVVLVNTLGDLRMGASAATLAYCLLERLDRSEACEDSANLAGALAHEYIRGGQPSEGERYLHEKLNFRSRVAKQSDQTARDASDLVLCHALSVRMTTEPMDFSHRVVNLKGAYDLAVRRHDRMESEGTDRAEVERSRLYIAKNLSLALSSLASPTRDALTGWVLEIVAGAIEHAESLDRTIGLQGGNQLPVMYAHRALVFAASGAQALAETDARRAVELFDRDSYALEAWAVSRLLRAKPENAACLEVGEKNLLSFLELREKVGFTSRELTAVLEKHRVRNNLTILGNDTLGVPDWQSGDAAWGPWLERLVLI